MAVKITHRTVGSLWTPQATFTVGGTNTDPTNLTVRIQDAAGTETILLNNVATAGLNGASTPVAKTATGIFKLNPGTTLSASGYWFAKFEGTGAAQATVQEQVIVDPDEFTLNAGLDLRALVGLAETKDWLQQQNIDVSGDLELVRVINDISDRFHQEAGREFKPLGTNPATRSFPIDQTGPSTAHYVDGVYFGEVGPYSRRLSIGDLTSFTQVQIIDSNDWTTVLETVSLTKITSYPTVRASWEPIRQLEFLSTVTGLSPGMRVSVTGTWGFPAVPGDVRQAVLDAVASVMDRDVEHYRQDLNPVLSGGSTAGAGTGTVVAMQFGGQRILALPPSAWAVAQRYRDLAVG